MGSTGQMGSRPGQSNGQMGYKVLDRWVIRYWTDGFQGTGQMGSEVLDIGVPRYWTDGFC